MTRHRPFRVLHGALIALVALALSASVLAHRVPSRFDLQIATISAAIGVAVDLCDAPGADDDNGISCEFCQIASGTLMPEPMTDLIATEGLVLAEIVLPRIRRAERLSLDLAKPTRGPPLA